MLKKFVDRIAVALVGILALLPLLLKFFQGVLKIPVPGSDVAVLNFVFFFSCIAGIITWREERHLNLASFTDKFPLWFQKIAKEVLNSVTIFVLTSLFLACICQLSNKLQFTDKFWGLSVKIFFSFLPVCYLSMIIMETINHIKKSSKP